MTDLLRPYLDTASGRRVHLLEPSPASVDLHDIVGALSRNCRFGGQSRVFYSIAQHAVLVHNLVTGSRAPEVLLAALHHDSHEAYVADLPSPLKRCLASRGQLEGYTEIQRRLDDAIAEALGFAWSDLSEEDRMAVKQADADAFVVEARRLLPGSAAAIRDHRRRSSHRLPQCPDPLPPERAAAEFLAVHRSIRGRRAA